MFFFAAMHPMLRHSTEKDAWALGISGYIARLFAALKIASF